MEMLVAIAIIAAMSVIGLPFYRSVMQNLNLNSVARGMSSDLRYAQQLSVTTQVNYSVTIDPISNYYYIKNSQTEEIIKTVTVKDNIDIQSVNDLPNNTATFNATGAAISTGNIILSNINNRQATIEIKPSGYVKIN